MKVFLFTNDNIAILLVFYTIISLYCIKVDALILLYIIINLFYWVLKIFLFCFCLVSKEKSERA